MKKKESAFDGVTERKAYWKQWKEDKALFLSDIVGIKGGQVVNKFLSGILVATSASKTMFNTAQEVVQGMECMDCLANTLCFQLIQPRPMPTHVKRCFRYSSWE